MKRYFIISLTVFLFTGCASGIKYQQLDTIMKADKCPDAAAYISEHESDYGDNNRLLFLLDTAMIKMACGEYSESNRYLHEAEDLAEELWTKSISRELGSFLTNDYLLPYPGEDFERALINLFSSINYMQMGEYDDALVECRRLDALLSEFNDKYEKKNVYKEDAFARYISGILYEADGKPDDAFIDYYNAYNTFKSYQKNYGTAIPRILAEDLLRTAELTSRTREALKILSPAHQSIKPPAGDVREKGSVVFIHLKGTAPCKREETLYIPTSAGPVTIAFPRFEKIPPSCRKSSLVLRSQDKTFESETVLVEDINEIAIKNLSDRKVRIIAKTIARAVAKQAAIHAASKGISDNKNSQDTAELIFNILNAFIERADTRSWRTLPGEIYMTRMFVPEGEYGVKVKKCSSAAQSLEDVTVKKGGLTVILHNSIYE